MKDGKTVEVGEVGKEGFAGIPALFGVSRSPVRVIVQISGGGFRVRSSTLQGVLRSTPELRLIMSRYAVYQGMCIAQTAACNRLHNIEQRLTRWLLITQDRVESPTFAITHDFLATMLGTDRPTLSSAAGILREKHAISTTRSDKINDVAFHLFHVILADLLRQSVYSRLAGYEASTTPNDLQPSRRSD
jgi:CRP-like cAMP-binding protein